MTPTYSESRTKTTYNLSVVIPVYNEEGSIPELHRSLSQVLNSIDCSYEILFIDDGSNDGSMNLLEELALSDERVKVIALRKNFGQSDAINAGIKASSGEVIILMDADLQNDPADIPSLLEKMKEGYDLVQGWRNDRKDDFWSRIVPSVIANWVISKVTNFQVHDLGCTLKAIRKDVAQELNIYGDMHRFIPIFASWRGARCIEIPVNHRPRKFGKSKYGIGRTFRVIVDFSLLCKEWCCT